MEQQLNIVTAEQVMGSTKHQIAAVVISALAGYAASRLAGAAYATAAVKVSNYRANKSA